MRCTQNFGGEPVGKRKLNVRSEDTIKVSGTIFSDKFCYYRSCTYTDSSSLPDGSDRDLFSLYIGYYFSSCLKIRRKFTTNIIR